GSLFNLGGYEYMNAGGYNVSDDVIDEFRVAGPAIVPDTMAPAVSLTAPADGATVSGTVTLSAMATDNVGVASVQFRLDGADLGAPVTGAGPAYPFSWNTAGAANGVHTLSAIARDHAGNTAAAEGITVTVDNPVLPPVISGVVVSGISATGATITWSTDKPADSQVAYGTTTAYGSLSDLDANLVTAHSVTLSNLMPSTTYHFQVLSRDAQGNLANSADFTFTTTAPPVVLPTLLH